MNSYLLRYNTYLGREFFGLGGLITKSKLHSVSIHHQQQWGDLTSVPSLNGLNVLNPWLNYCQDVSSCLDDGQLLGWSHITAAAPSLDRWACLIPHSTIASRGGTCPTPGLTTVPMYRNARMDIGSRHMICKSMFLCIYVRSLSAERQGSRWYNPSGSWRQGLRRRHSKWHYTVLVFPSLKKSQLCECIVICRFSCLMIPHPHL